MTPPDLEKIKHDFINSSAGLDENTARVATLGMGTCNVIMTVVSLVMVEKAGRKTLMLFGLSGMCVDVILLFFCIQFKVCRLLVIIL